MGANAWCKSLWSQGVKGHLTILVQNQGHEENSRNPSESIHLIISYCKNMMQQKLRGREKKAEAI